MTTFLDKLRPDVKTGIIIFSVFLLVAGLVFLIANLATKRPNAHNVAVWQEPVTICMNVGTLPDGWDAHHLAVATNSLQELNRLGPTFLINTHCDQRAMPANSVLVRNVALSGPDGTCDELGTARLEIGQFDSWIEIDPTCTHGDDEFRTAFIHEVGHKLGMTHICRFAGELPPGECSSVGFGTAVMNTSLVVDRGDPWHNGSTDEVASFPVPCFKIQSLDLKEFNRVHLHPGTL